MSAAFRLLLMGALAVSAWAADPINQRCPVLIDEAIDPSITVVWQGKTIGLCCQRCKRQFLEKPEAYAANLPAMASLAPTGGPGPSDQGDRSSRAGPPETAITLASRLFRWLGRFHPVVVHLPIALGLAAAVAEMIYVLRHMPGARAAARFAIAGAALGAMPAVAFGWFAAASGSYPGLESVLTWHRWLGTAAMTVLIAASVTLEITHRRQPIGRLRFLPLLLLALAGLVVGLVGHLGGTLVFGPDHFQW
jgi:uncharacterized membrane protein